jgi:Ca2+-binding RTX toxin-like protein
MTGGAGSDFFAFINGRTGGNDLITDFASNTPWL